MSIHVRINIVGRIRNAEYLAIFCDSCKKAQQSTYLMLFICYVGDFVAAMIIRNVIHVACPFG